MVAGLGSLTSTIQRPSSRSLPVISIYSHRSSSVTMAVHRYRLCITASILCSSLATLLLALSIAVAADTQTISADVINKKVERNVDISSQLVKIVSKITLENVGKSPLKTFVVAVEPEVRSRLSFIALTKSGGSDDSKPQLKLDRKDRKDVPLWEVTLDQSLEPGRTVVVEMETVFSHLLIPHPSQISQNEKQLIRYDGNLNFFSPYPTTTQTTNLALASANVESYTKTKPVVHSDSNINYGPYENVPAFSQNELSVHYENNSPFLTVTNLERVIEVSHWGNIAIEESIQLSHTGAVLKGSFSRYEYQRETSGSASIKAFKTVLPAAANDVYYRDDIGNISTSHLKVLEDSVEVDLRPRFPLFGGWKTNYHLGYNLPSYEYLFSDGENFLLKIRFVDHIFDDMSIDDVTVKIILPEGSVPYDLKFPYDVKIEKQQQHFTYLDTVGRPVVVVRKDNLVENHIMDCEIHYKFRKIFMLQEPLLVVLAFYLLFVLVIFYVRLDFSITKDECGEAKLRAASLRERVQQLQDRIVTILHQQEMLIGECKSKKDVPLHQAAQKKIGAELKTEMQSLQDLYTKLKSEAVADATIAAEKANELLKLDRQFKELMQQHVTLVEKLANDKVNKNVFVQGEKDFKKKKDDIQSKIDNIVASL